MEHLLEGGNSKQLSNWNFPLAQILEEYYTLLETSNKVDFGKSALILQNSANVYAHRVDQIWQDTNALNESCETFEEQSKSPKEGRQRKSKSAFDFDDFKPLQFENYIGRGIDLKEGHRNSIKLLSRRFTQLESNISQSKSPIKILSVQGEIIGNKYDFRCNQQLTKSCMLVDELSPNDLCEDISNTDFSGGRTSVALTCNTTFDSGFTSSIEDPKTPDLTVETELVPQINGVQESTEIQGSNDVSNPNSPERPASVCEPASENFDDTDQPLEDIDAGYISVDIEVPERENQLRRSKRTKNLVSVTPDSQKQVWEPIPFEQGVPEKTPKRETEFKLPCDISLLKSRSRKRKIPSAAKKKECLARLFLNENRHKKLEMYSPTRQLFTPLKKEEVEEFQKSFDDCFKTMRGSDMYHYQAVNNTTMELLGFQRNFRKTDPTVDNSAFATQNSIDDSTPIDDSGTMDDSESRLSPLPSAFTPPPTPEPDDRSVNYKALVEQKIRRITQNTTYRSKLEQRVAEWHRSLRPKLSTAECAPPFHIHQYGAQILHSLKSKDDKKIAFSNFVKNQPSPEVARYFLASLQLANTYNVAINAIPGSDCSIELELLGMEQHHKTLDTFQPPTTSECSTPSTKKVFVRLERLSLSEISRDSVE